MAVTGAPAKAPERSDNQIRNSVFLELKWDPKVTSDDIGVAVKNGIVALIGFVIHKLRGTSFRSWRVRRRDLIVGIVLMMIFL